MSPRGLAIQVAAVLAVLVALSVGGRWMPPTLEDRLRPARIALTGVLVILTGILILATMGLHTR